MRHTVKALVATRLFDGERAEVAMKAKRKRAAARAARRARTAAEHAPHPGPSPANPWIADAEERGLHL